MRRTHDTKDPCTHAGTGWCLTDSCTRRRLCSRRSDNIDLLPVPAGRATCTPRHRRKMLRSWVWDARILVVRSSFSTSWNPPGSLLPLDTECRVFFPTRLLGARLKNWAPLTDKIRRAMTCPRDRRPRTHSSFHWTRPFVHSWWCAKQNQLDTFDNLRET